ncbi:hypothetical protein AAVH_38263, partial [Aphelenchoides avenae]
VDEADDRRQPHLQVGLRRRGGLRAGPQEGPLRALRGGPHPALLRGLLRHEGIEGHRLHPCAEGTSADSL